MDVTLTPIITNNAVISVYTPALKLIPSITTAAIRSVTTQKRSAAKIPYSLNMSAIRVISESASTFPRTVILMML